MRTRQLPRLALLSLALALAVPSVWAAQPPGLGLKAQPKRADLQLPATDAYKVLADAIGAQKPGEPPRYAVVEKVQPLRVDRTLKQGSWDRLDDGRWVWRLRVESAGATSLDFGFTRYRLPAGAELYVYAADGSHVRGPFTDADNETHGELWTPIVFGDSAIVELVVEDKLLPYVELELGQVNRGFRKFWNSAGQKSGSCNVDVVCPEGDDWRDQIQSVAVYGLSGQGTFCTGQMVNSTANDRRELFLTANHCQITPQNAASLVVYWNFQNSTCRMPGSGASGAPGNGTLNQFQTGSVFRAKSATSTGVDETDFTLVELDDVPSPAFNVYWSGWDRRSTAPSSATAIHHPNTDEKRISFENDPLTVADYLQPTSGTGTHWRIADWDVGTTEPGSSGSGLWNPDKRLVGFLSGGSAACGNNSPDWYGRLSVAWDGTGTAERRLRDWLDPVSSGAQFINGSGSCSAPSVTINASTAVANVGQEVTFTAQVSGGAGSNSFAWDLDGDGGIDASGASVTTRWSRAFAGNVSVTVTDAAECETQATRAINVNAPEVDAVSVGTLQQLCGNGDTDMDPGERWRLPVTMRNNGPIAAKNGQAAFTKGSTGIQIIRSDTFGNSVADDTGGCGFGWVDVNSSPLALTAAGSFPALDDGRATNEITLGAPLNHYGSVFTKVVMTTNGYLSLRQDATGADFSNDCGATPIAPSSDVGARINVLHDDLVAGALRHQRFASCPRPADVGSNSGCDVFVWTGVGAYQGGGTPLGDFDMQAIVYDSSDEIVYQYRNVGGGENPGLDATIGLHRDNNADRLNYSCNLTGSVAQNRAVCFFHRDSQPTAISLAAVRLETPVRSVGNLGAGSTTSVLLDFALDTDAACGIPVNLQYIGAVDGDFTGGNPGGASVSPIQVLGALTASGADCQIVQGCPSQAPSFVPRSGNLFDPNRGGNGVESHVILPGTADVFYGAWFTGDRNRQPIWYIIQGTYQDGQVRAPIYQFEWNGASGAGFAVTNTVVGEALISWLDDERAVFLWALDGFGGEPLNHAFRGLSTPASDRTDGWFAPSQGGWGQTYNSYVSGSTARDFLITYLYDTAGDPRWVLGDAPQSQASVPQTALSVHCPGCPLVPIDFAGKPAGTLTRGFSGNSGTLSTSITLPAPLSGTWQRSNLNVEILTPPAGQ